MSKKIEFQLGYGKGFEDRFCYKKDFLENLKKESKVSIAHTLGYIIGFWYHPVYFFSIITKRKVKHYIYKSKLYNIKEK